MLSTFAIFSELQYVIGWDTYSSAFEFEQK